MIAGWRHFDDVDVTKIKDDKVVSPDAYVLVYRLRGTHDLMKSDRHLSLVPTVTAPSASPVNTPKAKRKRPDSVYCTERQTTQERKGQPDHTMNRMKRSISTESPITDTATLNPDQSWMPLRRSHSAASSYRPLRKQKGDLEYRQTEMTHSMSSESVNQADLQFYAASSSSLTSDTSDREYSDGSLLRPDFVARRDHINIDKQRRYSSPNPLQGAVASMDYASADDDYVGKDVYDNANNFSDAFNSFERLNLSEEWTKAEGTTEQQLPWQDRENREKDFDLLSNANSVFSESFADLAVSKSPELSNATGQQCPASKLHVDSLESLDLTSPLYREPADINENDLD